MDLTPELREKFHRFREAYLHAEERLKADDVKGSALAKGPYLAAQRETPLTPDELRLYKRLVAMHSVNGGELFADGSE